jgi:hypothetical protein
MAPRCTHYIHKEFLEGKEALCNKCINPFILTKSQLKNIVTVCLRCSRSPKKEVLEIAQKSMEDIIKELNDMGIRKDNLND